jgi:hypothetical protein
MYTTQAKVLEYLGLSALPSPLTSITNFLAYVTAFINTYCGRSFESESATYKLYDGTGTDTLLTDDFTAITKIEVLDADGNVDYTMDAATEYFTYPENSTAKNKLVLNSDNADVSFFPSGHKNIKVTATFGFSATVPDDVCYIATVLVANLITANFDLATGGVKSESLGEYSVSYADVANVAGATPEVKTLLERYRRIQFSGV